MSSGGEELLVARAHDFHQVAAADQRLVRSQKMSPLQGSAAYLFRNVLNVGKRFAVAVRGDRRETLVVALH